MKCPRCSSWEDKVIDSRALKGGAVIRRRRECLGCSHRFTTYEEIERADMWVVKRDGNYELFDRKKIISGMIKACEKRPVSHKLIEQAVDRLIEHIEAEYGSEAPSAVIGEKVMEALRRLDQVAYIRFASVYREFRDVSDFVDTVKGLETEEPLA